MSTPKGTCVHNAERFTCGHKMASRSSPAVHHSDCLTNSDYKAFPCHKHRVATSAISAICYYCNIPDDTKKEHVQEVLSSSLYKDQQLFNKVLMEKVWLYLSSPTIAESKAKYELELTIILCNTMEAHRHLVNNKEAKATFTVIDKVLNASVKEMMKAKAAAAAAAAKSDKIIADKAIAEEAIKAAAEKVKDAEWEKVGVAETSDQGDTDEEGWIML